ncbi:SOH1-domain-containing protein [Tothia fuscella]|uniref:Mediator of RNA polymerase II transcription subunit 31 n=1 Tax=Tothia fuscella TaxID=1048955 RepID=A0A9P4NVA9_9PEZI|nr:SOH1-domain-containing protein [Tothia fuscella]
MADRSSQETGDRTYGGFTRFELELEFVQCLANPWYMNHLAVQKYLEVPEFVAYLDYLQYFKEAKYAKYLIYPGPTLQALELLQQERFRKDIVDQNVVFHLINEGLKAGTERP